MSRHLVVNIRIILLKEHTRRIIPHTNSSIEDRVLIRCVLLKEELNSPQIHLSKEIGVEHHILFFLVVVDLVLVLGQFHLPEQVDASAWLLLLFLSVFLRFI